MAGRPALRALVALAAAAAVLAASCGGGGGSAAVTVSPDESEQAAGSRLSEPVRIRLALAPDPIWEWLKDSGTVMQWEAANNIRIEASNPFDPFAAFAGGHVDIVVVNVLDVPRFVNQSNREPVVIGKHTTDRSILAVRRTSRAETLDDLIEARIAVESPLGSTLLWGLIAEGLHGLDLRVDGPDFELVVVDAASVADLVVRNEVDACICVPDFGVPHLADGTLRVLYGGRSAAEIYAHERIGIGDVSPVADVWLTDVEWHRRNEAAAAAFLELWNVGLGHWRSNRATMVADYPHLFSVTGDNEIAWIADYASRHDWFVTSAHISSDEERMHDFMAAEMVRIGLTDIDFSLPRLHTVGQPDPASDYAEHRGAEQPIADRSESTRG